MIEFRLQFLVASLAAGVAFMLPSSAAAGIYYVDWDGGNDLNDGRAKSTAWQRHPYMYQFGGSYSHFAGDVFIFKGGVTWPNACFMMDITKGGSSTNNRDRYTVDKTWYTGENWTRPVFDGEGIRNARATEDKLVRIYTSNIEMSGIELTGSYQDGALEATMGIMNTGGHLFSNLYVHSWVFPTTNYDGNNGGIIAGQWSDSIIDSCTIHGTRLGDDTTQGMGVRFIRAVKNSTIFDCSNGILHTIECVSNTIYGIGVSTDSPTTHENGVWADNAGANTTYVYGNTIHDVRGGTTLYVVAGGWGYPNSTNKDGTWLIYNNLFYDNVPVAINIDRDTPANLLCNVYVHNNTFELTKTYGALHTTRRGIDIDLVAMTNNHYISWTTSNVNFPQSVTAYTQGNNLTQTHAEAASEGYVVGNLYSPVPGGSTIDAGASLAALFDFDMLGVPRPQGQVWDIGAYEFPGGSVSEPDTIPPAKLPPPAPDD